MGKFYDIDPETCSIDELKKAIEHVKDEENYYHNMEQSAKIFINSVYGVFGTEFFNLCNTDIAESITLQGQHLIKYSVEQINDYFRNKWHLDFEAHKKIAEKMKATFPDFDTEKFLKTVAENPLQFETLQCYGDSVTGDTKVHTLLYGEISIEDLWKKVAGDGDCDEKVRVTPSSPIGVLAGTNSGGMYMPVSYIMRHKARKKMYRITVSSGNYVDVTEDHSVMIYHGDNLSEVKPSVIVPNVDETLVYVKNENFESGMICTRDHIVSVSVLSKKYDGYVYDISIDSDESEKHTFFGNGILVHNTDSAYITLQPIIDLCNIPLEQQTHFDVAIYEAAMEEYLNERFDYYAKVFNCKKNLEKFELEKISRTIIMQAKKRYACDVAWVDTGDYLHPLSHVTYTGVMTVQGTTSEYCRKEVKGFYEFVLDKLNRGEMPSQGEIVKKLREIKSRFILQSPNDITFNKGLSDYESWVKNDKAPQIEYFPRVDKNNRKLSPPIHVRAAAIYNNTLFNKGAKYISKYEPIKTGDKMRFYYVNENEVFAFVPDAYPAEFAPPVNVDIQFEKIILSNINMIVTTLGYPEVPKTLTYTRKLF